MLKHIITFFKGTDKKKIEQEDIEYITCPNCKFLIFHIGRGVMLAKRNQNKESVELFKMLIDHIREVDGMISKKELYEQLDLTKNTIFIST